MLELLFNKVAGLQVFSYVFCEIFQNTSFVKHYRAATSVLGEIFDSNENDLFFENAETFSEKIFLTIRKGR